MRLNEVERDVCSKCARDSWAVQLSGICPGGPGGSDLLERWSVLVALVLG
jgi:hypothetical protein